MTPRSKAGPALSNDPQSGELSEGPHPQDKKRGSCQDRARKVAWHLAGLDRHTDGWREVLTQAASQQVFLSNPPCNQPAMQETDHRNLGSFKSVYSAEN